MKAEQLFLSLLPGRRNILLMFVYRSDNGGILQSLFRENHIIGEKGFDFVKSLYCK